MKLLLTGATGAVGSQILRDAVSDPAISTITVLARRALPEWLTRTLPPNDKTSTVILDDFLKYPSDLPPKLAAHDACIWALGTSSVGKSEQEYTKITYDYVVSMISALQSGGVKSNNEPLRFVFISADGADPDGIASKALYGRVKRLTELYLLDLPDELGIRPLILRPGYFFPSDKELAQKTRSFGERVVAVAAKPIYSNLIPSKYMPIEDLGRFTVAAAKGVWGSENLFGNARMRELLKGQTN